jgi:hypothetical protein
MALVALFRVTRMFEVQPQSASTANPSSNLAAVVACSHINPAMRMCLSDQLNLAVAREVFVEVNVVAHPNLSWVLRISQFALNWADLRSPKPRRCTPYLELS